MDLQIQPPLPSKRDFRVGILGSGFVVNECHLPAYRKAGFNPVAIASRNRRNAEQAAQRHGIPKVYDSYDDLLDDPSIEVLDIAVPPLAQLSLIQRACARKNVRGILAQRPLGVNYHEAVTAASLCRQAGIVLSVNQSMRYEQSVRAAKALLQNGVIGAPVFATIEMRGVPRRMPWQADLDWLTLRSISIDHLDCFRYWFGDPAGIYCSIRPDPRAKFPHEDGICTYILEYANSLRCVGIDDPWTGPAEEGCPADNYLRWRIEGMNGLAIGDIGWHRDAPTAPSIIKDAAKGDQGFHEPKWTESRCPDAFIGTMAQLLIALETGTEPAISAADNLKTMALVEAAYASTQGFTSINMEDFKVPTSLVANEIKKLGFYDKVSSKLTASAGDFGRDKTWNRLTPRSQQVLMLARKEADWFHHSFVSPEHLLLGIMALGNGPAYDVLFKCRLDLSRVREEVGKEVGTCPDQVSAGKIPFSPRVREVLARAALEAKNLNHSYIGMEHILLGLLREGDGAVPHVLKNLGVDVEKTRAELLQVMNGMTGSTTETKSEKPGFFSQLFSKVVSAEQPERGQTINNFTPRAQQVLALARKEADRFNHNFVGTEHLLLGLIALGQGVSVNVLQKLGLDMETVRMEVEKHIGAGPDQKMIGNIPYTPRVKKVLALAAKEARNLNHTYVGTEHILLGLLREGDGVAARVLKNLDINVEETRQEILRELDPNFAVSSSNRAANDLNEQESPNQTASKPSVSAVPLAQEEAMNVVTPRARQALALARKEAERLNHLVVGSEHLMLGIIALGQGVAFEVLAKLGLELEKARAEVEKQVGTGVSLRKVASNFPYTPQLKKVLASASKVAKSLNHAYVGTEHILLGLLSEEEGGVPQMFKSLGVDAEKTRLEVLKALDPSSWK
jgi:predicted dehydrogenase